MRKDKFKTPDQIGGILADRTTALVFEAGMNQESHCA